MSTFQAAGLQAEIVSAITEMGFKDPTPIQEKAIPFLLSNERDLIALAQTGTGKTAAFGLPLIQLTDPVFVQVQALILCPTRELCLQIAGDLADFSRHMPKVRITPVYGGANIDTQVRSLRRNPQIVVGTPGRTLDLINRGDLRLDSIDVLVLDEADEMLDRGFKHDLDAILRAMPRNKRTWLFSATMPEEINRIARNYLHEPEKISVGQKNAGARNVEHEYYIHEKKGRYGFLKELIRNSGAFYGIVFTRTKRKAREVARRLKRDGFRADALQGDMSQPQRDRVMKKFRQGQIKVLVATDVAARGVDVDELTHVINFNLPDEDAVYIHRSGRTGRANRKGISIAIIDDEERGRIRGLERMAKKSFTPKDLGNVTKASKHQAEAEPERRTPQAAPERKAANGEPNWDWPELQGEGGREEKVAPKRDLIFDKIDRVLNADIPNRDLEEKLPMIEDYLRDVSKEQLIRHLVGHLGQPRSGYKRRPGSRGGSRRGKKVHK